MFFPRGPRAPRGFFIPSRIQLQGTSHRPEARRASGGAGEPERSKAAPAGSTTLITAFFGEAIFLHKTKFHEGHDIPWSSATKKAGRMGYGRRNKTRLPEGGLRQASPKHHFCIILFIFSNKIKILQCIPLFWKYPKKTNVPFGFADNSLYGVAWCDQDVCRVGDSGQRSPSGIFYCVFSLKFAAATRWA